MLARVADGDRSSSRVASHSAQDTHGTSCKSSLDTDVDAVADLAAHFAADHGGITEAQQCVTAEGLVPDDGEVQGRLGADHSSGLFIFV